MNYEIQALQQNKTYIFVNTLALIKPIGSVWVYKVKHKEFGTIDKYKERLIIMEYNKIEEIDFFEIFSYVPESLL